MSVWQQVKPKSGDHRSTSGGPVASVLKQTTIGPYVAPWLNSWRDQGVQLGASKTAREGWCSESMRVRSWGDAWVESLALRNVICMVTRLACASRFVTHRV